MSFYYDNPVPKGPPELCFDSLSFTRETFSVDLFLQEHRNKASLETMRDDLGIYLKVLRSAMIDLINKDYADFVNLSTNLIGLDKAINNLQLPLGQLREELLEVRQAVEGAHSDISNQLGHLRQLRDAKRSLRSLNRVQSSLKKLQHLLSHSNSKASAPDVQLLERIVAEYNQIQFHVKRCRRDFSSNDNKVFEKVGDTLVSYLDQLFLESVRGGGGEGGQETLLRVLTLYQSLDMLHLAERLYRTRVVRPALEKVISEDTLKSSPTGLSGLYQRLLGFLQTEMRPLTQLVQLSNQHSGKNKCDFFLHSFWPEVEERLETNLSLIFAPGDPEVFYQKYTDSLRFLESLISAGGSSISEFQKDPHFLKFMDKWDLPVYFQIRFLEIVKDLEAAFVREPWLSSCGDSRWKLAASEAVWRSLTRCWAPGVYLTQIAHKFWKLTLQIISRFTTWIKSFEKNPKSSRSQDVDFLVYLYSDVECLLSEFPSLKELVIQKLPTISDHSLQQLADSLEESGSALGKELLGLDSLVTSALLGNSFSLLRQVNDIPRLYRRTNREHPRGASSYVAGLLGPPTTFHGRHSSHPRAVLWLAAVFSSLTKQYYSCVSEVLDSVQKTEESLRRLKKARDRSVSLVPNDRRVEDDNKIRAQLHLDVTAYAKGIEGFGIQKGSIEKLNDLLLLVEATQKS